MRGRSASTFRRAFDYLEQGHVRPASGAPVLPKEDESASADLVPCPPADDHSPFCRARGEERKACRYGRLLDPSGRAQSPPRPMLLMLAESIVPADELPFGLDEKLEAPARCLDPVGRSRPIPGSRNRGQARPPPTARRRCLVLRQAQRRSRCCRRREALSAAAGAEAPPKTRAAITAASASVPVLSTSSSLSARSPPGAALIAVGDCTWPLTCCSRRAHAGHRLTAHGMSAA